MLEVCRSLEVANLAEECWIELLETRDPAKGFNLARGGAHTPHPMKNPWDRPEFREANLPKMKERLYEPTLVAQRQAASRAAWKDPALRKRVSTIWSEIASTPEGRAQRVAAAKPGKNLSDEHRQKISSSSRCQDPEVKARITEATRTAMARPEVRAKFIGRNNGVPHSEEHKSKIGEASKTLWQDPAYREKVAAAQTARLAARPARETCFHGHSLEHQVIHANGRRRCKQCIRERKAQV